MALKKTFPAPTNAAISSVDSRADLAGLIVRSAAGLPRAGVFPRSTTALVTGKASMAVDIAAFEACLVRTGYPALIANDASASLALDAAPASNSRIDLVWVRQKESQSPFADADDLPAFGFTKGTAAASPVPDTASVPAGALVLAQVLIPSTATTTLSGGVVITQLHDYTCTTGGVIWFRSTTNRDAVTYAEGQLGWLVDTNRLQVFDGTNWIAVSGGRVRIIPTQTSTGGTVAVDSATGEITATGALTQLNVTVPGATLYKGFEVTYWFRSGTSGTYAVKLLVAGAPDATASSYRGARLTDATAGALTPGTSWVPAAGNRLEHFRKAVISALAQAKITIWDEVGGQSDAATNEGVSHLYMRHTNPVALDGFRFDFSSMGTFTDLSVTIEGIL